MLAAGLVVTALLYGLAVAPAAARLENERMRIAELKQQYAEAMIFQKQKRQLSGLQEGALRQKDVPLLIKDLAQMARRHNCSVGAINSDIPTPASSGLTMITFTVPVSGSYPALKQYIYDVETSDKLVGIQDLRFSGEKNAVKLDLKLITYLRGE